jgi:hypothetical protein
MFVTTGVGCTCSPPKSRRDLPHEGVRPRRSAVAAAAVPFLPISCHTPKIAPFVLNNLPTLFPARNPQPSRFHALAHSFTREKKPTLVFPVTSKLFVRSLAQERKSTPLLSNACARFCRNGGVWQLSVIVTLSPSPGRPDLCARSFSGWPVPGFREQVFPLLPVVGRTTREALAIVAACAEN